LPAADVIQYALVSDDFEVRHHPLIFMLELVAVDQVAAPVSIKANQDVNALPIVEEDSVLPTTLPGEEPAAPATA